MTQRENVILAYQHKPTVWIPNSVTDCNLTLQQAVNERYEGKESGLDEFGVEYMYNAEANAPMVKPGTRRLSSIQNWREEVVFPDVKSYDWEAAAAKDTANWDRENRFSVVMMFNGMFERMHMMMGFEDSLLAVAMHKKDMMEWCEAFTNYRIELIQHIAKYYKPDSVMVFDDYGEGRSMFMRPEVWRKIFKPQLKRLVDATHDCGLYYTLHSCGYIKPIFEDFVELGVDAVQPLQVSNDVPELKAKYGDRITFCGGYNNVHVLDRPDVTEPEIRAEVRRVLKEVGAGGSFVSWASIFSGETVAIYLDEILKHSIPQMEAAGIPVPDYDAQLRRFQQARAGSSKMP